MRGDRGDCPEAERKLQYPPPASYEEKTTESVAVLLGSVSAQYLLHALQDTQPFVAPLV